jgi:Zn-dependent protease with chaperone function
MDFFERQRQVRRLSVRLVLLFVLAVVGIVIVVDLAAVLAFRATDWRSSEQVGLLATATVGTVGAIGLAALFRTVSLRGGGGRVARELGGVSIPPDTTDPELRRLRNVVEEMAIASGVPVPEVYLLPEETGINAFAAGWSTSDAAVAVTRGALERLNRDELQGVIAHEFSHVLNGDMRLNIRLMGLLFGILFLAVIGRTMLRFGFVSRGSGRGGKSGGNPLPLVGLAMMVAGYIGVLAGRLIQASVSRQREYLADASAVQFTRQTQGIAGALKKIGGVAGGSGLASPKREEVGHMLFGSGVGQASWFATHPPLADRIRALDPGFDPVELRELARGWATAPPSGRHEDVALGLIQPGDAPPRTGVRAPGALPAPSALPAAGAQRAVAPAAVLAQVASQTDVAYAHAETILSHIPAALLARARAPATVVPLVLGLLFSEEPQVRARQLAVLAERHGRTLADACRKEAEAVAGLHPLLRLPLAQLAFPALRDRPGPEREAVLAAVFTLIHADGRISVSEYCLSRLLHSELRESMHPNSRWRIDRRTLTDARAAAGTLLATLAAAGHTEHRAAERAFQAGVGRLMPSGAVPYTPPEGGALALETTWPVLDGLRPADKERLVAAVVAVISHDGVLTVAETELLRTVCGLLHSPLPPLVGETFATPAEAAPTADERPAST